MQKIIYDHETKTKIKVDLTAEEIAEFEAREAKAPSENEVLAAERKVEIKKRLNEIDLEEIRPIGSITVGKQTDEDVAKLATLEAEKAALRSELAGL